MTCRSTPHHFRRLTAFLLLAALPSSASEAAAEDTGKTAASAPPSILLILVDDLGYGDLSCQGATDLRTPHIDRLAARGMKFTEFYANCPVCSPTRAAVLSGCYPDRVGVPGVIRTHAEN
ncbi:MAG: sulfatase-like hydrolase/transferase, partial [Planctomycetaceae bacterium]|nr:sulfatase-like hydrolase/transferase [Planctomycetaceae bacterium]